ncbi:hypothetical protein GND98_014340 [Clostridium butyricum]|jgi:hypothetical protein|uniref:Uncharacterized protein n=1 Tax=Clostridium butyricum TaxID=1492 RepID=A0A6L9EQV3_CLOBU|nr:hypothetical protein [Clostridium butyricum]
MKPGIVISKEEVHDIVELMFKPDEIKNVFNIKRNIKAYANIEKLDGYALVHLGDKLNEMANNLSNELAKMEDEQDRKEVIYKFMLEVDKVKDKNMRFLMKVVLVHRVNKRLNKYLLN